MKSLQNAISLGEFSAKPSNTEKFRLTEVRCDEPGTQGQQITDSSQYHQWRCGERRSRSKA